MNAWLLHDVARALKRNTVNYSGIVHAIGMDVVRGTVVGLRPNGTLPSPAWRRTTVLNALKAVDYQVAGDASLARRLSHEETLVRSAELTDDPDLDAVVLVGVLDYVDALADLCHRRKKLLAVADHPRTGMWSVCGAADVIIELGSNCFCEAM